MTTDWQDPEAVRRFSGRMLTESERLGRLVQQVIELSRLQHDDALDTLLRLDQDHEGTLAVVALDAPGEERRPRWLALPSGTGPFRLVAYQPDVQGQIDEPTWRIGALVAADTDADAGSRHGRTVHLR